MYSQFMMHGQKNIKIVPCSKSPNGSGALRHIQWAMGLFTRW